MRGILALAFIGLAWASNASAAKYQLTFSATVTGYRSVDRDFNEVNIPSAIEVGDAISVSTYFDTDAFVVQSLFDADPSINIYYGATFGGKHQLGAYAYATPLDQTDFSSLQLWNNYFVAAHLPNVDAFSMSIFGSTRGAMLPVDLGAGPINLSISLYNFDFTGTARTNDLVSQITPLDLFASKVVYFGFINADTYLQTAYTTTNIRALLTPLNAVPEPSTWLLLLSGFAVVGGALRAPRGVKNRADFVGQSVT